MAGAVRPAAKPTIRVVAQRARVAISTVSRVLNGGRASEAARDRVKSAIQELGYTPSITAQSLVSRRTGCIGLAVNSSQSPWFSQILGGVEEALASSHESVLLASLMQAGRYDGSPVARWIREARIDGLVFVRYGRRNRALLQAAGDARLPVVLIAPDVLAPVEFVARCDNVQAGRLVAEHLAELGHRRIAFAGGPEESLDTRNRLKGLRAALAARGIKLRERDVWFGDSYGPESGLASAQKFLERRERDRASAVVLGNDAMAIGFMRRLLEAGVRIPLDVSVVGFDGVPDGELFWPGLTTVVQPTWRMAASACRALLERLKHPERERVLSAVEYGVELLVRQSTAPPRPRP